LKYRNNSLETEKFTKK